MGRQRDDDENEDANAVTVNDPEDLLDEMFTDRSEKSDGDLTIDCGENPVQTRPTAPKDVEILSTSRTNSATEQLPVLERAISQGAYFDERLRSPDPDHTVGRTRVPWHSKSISDLRDPDSKPTRVVAFDVRGKLFRCKESLIAKYPLKRLNQIITCGCGKISCLDDAFYIDRNPHHFEMILDWYRTGKLVRQRNVNEESFKDDAIYFDLYEEMFPPTPTGDAPQSWPNTKGPPGLPTRRRSVNDVDLGPGIKKRVSMFASLPSPPIQHATVKKPPELPTKTESETEQDVSLPASTDEGPLRFFRRERRVLIPTSTPLVFMIRKFEQLVVESVKGRGKLMVRVCDATGMQTVDVPEAVLFDSHSRFYLKGGRAQLQHNALLPGEHVYTFWMEENATTGSIQTSSSPALDIEFKLLFTFNPSDRLTATMEAELSHAASECNDAIQALTAKETPPVNLSFSPRLFLPPLHVQRAPERVSLSDETSKCISPKKPPKQLSPLSRNRVKRGNQQKPSPIRHAGAAVVRGGEGKITVYRPEKLNLDPASESSLLGLHHDAERSIINQAVETAYHEMQPRLFR